jgi:[ribosomal protein S5]-alanine N-acetyltransferase
MQNEILTQRLILNILTLEDHQFIIELLNSEGWKKFIGDRNVHAKEEAIAYISKILSSQNIYYWVVRTKDGDIPIGIISFLKRSYLEHFDIGFAFLPEFHGQGFAYEAASEILDMVKAASKYDLVLATTVPGNINSIRLLEKLGLYFEKEIEVGGEKLHIYTSSKAES